MLEARGDALLDEQAVNDDFDRVIFALVEHGRRVENQKVERIAKLCDRLREGIGSEEAEAPG